MAELSGQVQQLDGSYKRVTKLNNSIRCTESSGKALQVISYASQVIIIFTVIVACIVNLSLGDDKSALWSSLLSLALGCMLPNPKLRRDVKQRLLPGASIELQPQILSEQHNDTIHNTPTEDGGIDGRFLGMCSN